MPIPDSLRTLLTGLIDYAGLYPPAALPLPAVLVNYETYLTSPEAWMLNRLVLPAAKLPEVRLGQDWRVTLLVDGEPGPLPRQVETLETKLPQRLSLPTYCEAPIGAIENGFAKVRAGGATPEAVPLSSTLAEFLGEAARRRIPFKATAGLHHPIRRSMHGFINVFVAAAFAWQGAERGLLSDVLDETNAGAFEFRDGEMGWQGREIRTAEMASARHDFAHSFGSCSFEEPVADLRALGWLPARPAAIP
jgi:hypothetical protein